MTDNKFPIYIDLSAFFEALGLSGLSPEELAKQSADMQDAVQRRIMNRIVVEMDEETAAKVVTMKEDEAVLYLADKGINLLDVAEQETNDYIEELSANIKTAKQFIQEQQNGGAGNAGGEASEAEAA